MMSPNCFPCSTADCIFYKCFSYVVTLVQSVFTKCPFGTGQLLGLLGAFSRIAHPSNLSHAWHRHLLGVLSQTPTSAAARSVPVRERTDGSLACTAFSSERSSNRRHFCWSSVTDNKPTRCEIDRMNSSLEYKSKDRHAYTYIKSETVIIVTLQLHLLFGRHFYPKRLTESTFVEVDSNISLWYIKIRIEQVSSVHSCKANRTSFIIAWLPA